jgi:hypothetical protein
MSGAVRRLQVEELVDDLRAAHASPRSPRAPRAEEPAEVQSSNRALETAVTVIQAGAYALSARALLLLAMIGVFVLADQAMASQTLTSLIVLVIYGLLTVPALTYLEVRRGRAP